MPQNKLEQFNLVILGVGGQGLITLLKIISQAAREEGYDLKTSELHGLSQRGGSVEVHIRFGRQIYSPLVARGEADLILSLEAQETLRGLYFSGEKTKFLADEKMIPIPFEKPLTLNKISAELNKGSDGASFIPAAEICRDKLGKEIVAGIYLLGQAVSKKMIPLKPASFVKAIKKIIPEKYSELNVKAFNLTD
jgi:indolepyruvate ferredoxin oxidoreductase beta subunit